MIQERKYLLLPEKNQSDHSDFRYGRPREGHAGARALLSHEFRHATALQNTDVFRIMHCTTVAYAARAIQSRLTVTLFALPINSNSTITRLSPSCCANTPSMPVSGPSTSLITSPVLNSGRLS